MTLLTPATRTDPARPPVWPIGPPRLLAGLDGAYRLDLVRHRAVHPSLPKWSRGTWGQALETVAMAGRGGAGFPVARKLAALPSGRAYAVVVNGSESEPASYKDRALLRRAPHLVLDGALALAAALKARRIVVVVHDVEAQQSIRQALSERRDSRRASVVSGPGPFVAGEARAVLQGISGKAALPPGRRTLPTDRGLDGRPTFLSNAETFAQLALLGSLGPTTYADIGHSDEPGTSLVTVSGAVVRPGVVELPHGTPLTLLLRAVGATGTGPVLLGGYHGGWVVPDDAVLLMRPALRARSATLGAGVVVALGDDTCPLGEVARVASWLAAQSSGQCGPCVLGLPSIAADLARMCAGNDPGASTDLERHLSLVAGRGACAHPDGAVRFIASGVRAFAGDVAAHQHGGCGRPVLGQLPLPAARWPR